MKKLTSAEDAIKQAIEGGWKPNWKMKKDWRVELGHFFCMRFCHLQYSVLPGIRIYDNDTTIYSSWLTYAEIFTDPLFWQALGKVRGWKEWTRICIVHEEIATEETAFYEKCDRCENDTYCEKTAFRNAHKWLSTRLLSGVETLFWQNLP